MLYAKANFKFSGAAHVAIKFKPWSPIEIYKVTETGPEKGLEMFQGYAGTAGVCDLLSEMAYLALEFGDDCKGL